MTHTHTCTLDSESAGPEASWMARMRVPRKSKAGTDNLSVTVSVVENQQAAAIATTSQPDDWAHYTVVTDVKIGMNIVPF